MAIHPHFGSICLLLPRSNTSRREMLAAYCVVPACVFREGTPGAKRLLELPRVVN